MARLLARNLILDDVNADGQIREGTVPVFADVTALKAIAAADRWDGMVAVDAATGRLYQFDAEATSATLSEAQEPWKLIPAAGTGKWFLIGANGIAMLDEFPQRVLNNSGGGIAASDVVFLGGYDGTTGLPTIRKAQSNASTTLGSLRVAINAIAHGKVGYVCRDAIITAQNTAAGTVGAPVYVSSAAAGARVLARLTGANRNARCGRVLVVDGAVGVIHFRGDDVYEEGHTHADAAEGGQLDKNGLAASALFNDVTGRAIVAPDFFDRATLLDKVVEGAIEPVSQGMRIWNGSGGAFAAGDLVYESGFNVAADLPEMNLASNSTAGCKAVYVCTGVIANGAAGTVVRKARVTALQTAAWAPGAAVYLSELGTTTNTWTGTAPTAANRCTQRVGRVVIQNAGAGSIDFDLSSVELQAVGSNEYRALSVLSAAQGDLGKKFISVHIPGATFTNPGPIRTNILPGVAGVVQAVHQMFDPGPANGGNVIVDLNKNGVTSCFATPPDFSLNLNPSAAYWTIDNGVTYDDDTAEVTGAGVMDIGALDILANGDSMVFGHATLKFGRMYVNMDGINVNAVASVMAVQYWDGAAWQFTTGLVDGTNAAGATLGQDGVVSFDIPANWAPHLADAFWVGSVAGYYIRISVSVQLTAGTAIDAILVGHGIKNFYKNACDAAGANRTFAATDVLSLVVDDADGAAANGEFIIEYLPL